MSGATISDTNISHIYTNDTNMIKNDIRLSHSVTNNHSIQISEKFKTCAQKSRAFGFLPKTFSTSTLSRAVAAIQKVTRVTTKSHWSDPP